MSSYKADPNNNVKQVPNNRPSYAIGKAITPANKIHEAKRPNYVLINTIGNYSFCYDNSGSYPADFISGSKIENAAGGPVKLDIQPTAWAEEDGKTGDVTFVYLGDVG